MAAICTAADSPSSAPAEASDAYERALVLTRADITGLPLSTELPLQLALTRLSSGDIESGVDWLLRVSIADRSDRVVEGLRTAEVGPHPLHTSEVGDALRRARFRSEVDQHQRIR